MKINLIPLLLFLTFRLSAQTPCEVLTAEFPFPVTTESHFLMEGDTIFSQDTSFTEVGIYPFYFETETGCDSLVQVNIFSPEVRSDWQHFQDTIYFESQGCEPEKFCLSYQPDIYNYLHLNLDGEDLGFSEELFSCFSNDFILSSDIESWFPEEDDVFPMQVFNLYAYPTTNGEELISFPPFYITSPEDFVYHIKNRIPDLNLWYKQREDFSFMLYQDQRYQIEGFVETGDGLDAYILLEAFNLPGFANSLPGLTIDCVDGENTLLLTDESLEGEKVVTIFYSHTFPEINVDYLTYSMPLGQTAIFPIIPDDLCGEVISIEEICPEELGTAVEFELQDNQTVKFKANAIGTSNICYELCEQSGRCDTFNLQVDVYEPEVSEDPADEFKHNLFPNPAQNTLHFTEAEEVFIKEITIYDSTGQLIDIVNLAESHFYDLDVSRYAEGLYFAVRELENEDVFTEKFVVQR